VKEDEPLREPVVTGAIRVEIYGDRERGIAFSHRARAQLGLMLNYHGVPERIAAGEPGGFFHSSHTYAGGVRIQTLTNNGQHTARIFVPPLPKPTVEEEEEEVKEEPRGLPYLWVGIRSKYQSCTAPWYALQAMMIEPLVDERTRGIIGNSINGWYEDINLVYDSDDVASLRPGGAFATIDDAIVEFHDTWVGLQPNKLPGDHCLSAFDWDEGSWYYFSKNGLRLYDAEAMQPPVPDPTRWAPVDPQMDDEQNAGSQRDYTGRVASFFGPNADRGWDLVYVIDPGEDDGVDPVDDRPQILKSSAFLQTIGMAQGEDQVLPGEYVLAVFAYADNVATSDRPGEAIPGHPGLFRSTDCDYQEHLTDQDFTPLQVEVEVRIGKGIDATVFNFDLTCPVYDTRFSTTIPFGTNEATDPCSGEGGVNPLGTNFAPRIDVEGGTAVITEADLTPVLGGRSYQEPELDHRSEMDIYIFGDYAPAVDDADFPAKAAAAVHTSLEAMSSGSYGCSILTERSEAHLLGSLAGIHYVWKYSVISDVLTSFPIISAPGDYSYGPGSYYNEFLYWYYPYQRISRNQCHHVFAIVCQAGPTFLYDGDQNLGPDVPAPECC
jgi:hypothetical protein